VSRSFCSSLHPSGRLRSPSGLLSVLDQVSDSFQIQIKEDWFNSSDDVESRPDALLHKVRITIQIQPSERLSAWSGRASNRYGNCVFNFNRPDACLPWSERALNQYGNCVLKINRPDDHPPWSRRTKPYMKITCKRTCDRPDDSASTSGRGSETRKIFSENLRNSGRTVVHPNGPFPPSGRHPYISQQSPI
jgi:hypothetical protein